MLPSHQCPIQQSTSNSFVVYLLKKISRNLAPIIRFFVKLSPSEPSEIHCTAEHCTFFTDSTQAKMLSNFSQRRKSRRDDERHQQQLLRPSKNDRARKKVYRTLTYTKHISGSESLTLVYKEQYIYNTSSSYPAALAHGE